MSESVSFKAYFPAIQSAIKITGDGTGMRIQLDIPQSEMAEAVKLLLYTQTVLKVTIEPESKSNQSDEQSTNGDIAVKRSTAKQRKR